MTTTRISSYEQALGYLLGITRRGIRPGLSRIRRALAALGHPERSVPSVVVGGTNGKGSVASLVARAAHEQGLKVGLFTSPHIHRLTERIRVRDREVGRRRLVEALRAVQPVVERPGGPELTFFEMMTVMAAEIFAEEGLDLAVLEVGLGGRLDATRTFPARVVAITSIALDHQSYLGDTLEAIAAEKFALARRGAIVVAGDLQPSLAAMLEERARHTRSPLWRAGVHFSWKINDDATIDYKGPDGPVERLSMPLRGAHQAHNLAVAATVTAAMRRRGLDVSTDALRSAARRLRWPARMEVGRGGRVVFDVAHNPAGSEALCAELPSLTAGRRPVVVVLGCMRDKDVEGIAKPLRAIADEIYLAAPNMPRALEPKAFPRWIRGRAMASVDAALSAALDHAGETGVVVVTGSTFLVAEARATLLGIENVDPPVPM